MAKRAIVCRPCSARPCEESKCLLVACLFVHVFRCMSACRILEHRSLLESDINKRKHARDMADLVMYAYSYKCRLAFALRFMHVSPSQCKCALLVLSLHMLRPTGA